MILIKSQSLVSLNSLYITPQRMVNALFLTYQLGPCSPNEEEAFDVTLIWEGIWEGVIDGTMSRIHEFYCE